MRPPEPRPIVFDDIQVYQEVAGAFAGYHARMRLAKALDMPDIYVAPVEDLICAAGAVWVVTRFQ
jgi:hypothetical protein